MSGFAALFRFDGAPADPAVLSAMTESISYRAPDGKAQWVNGSAAISHLMLRTTAESLEETQPLANEDASVVLAMDGWLANYEELRAELTARGARLRTRADAELVLRAFEVWGDACLRHIEGEYAFVIWDVRRREALCATDHGGLKPLHYHWDGKRLLVASDLAGVLAPGDFEQRPNFGMVAQHLSNRWYTRDDTLWEGVARLPPAHAMRVGVAGPQVDRYWIPSPDVKIRYRDDCDYEAHYRDLMADIVRRASRTHLPLACEISGGLDSSTIFAVAHELKTNGRRGAPALIGYTFNYGPDATPEVDEIDYARAVAQHLGASMREIAPFMPELGWFVARGRANRDMSPYPNAAAFIAIGEALSADGCRVILSGEGGDQFLSALPFDYGEYIAERDWGSLRQSMREDREAFGFARAFLMLTRFGTGPALPQWLRRIRRSATRPGNADCPGLLLLTGELTAALERSRRSGAASTEAFAGLGRHAQLMMAELESPFTVYAHNFMSRDCARGGYERRNPFFAKSHVEFACAIPSGQLRRGAMQKHLLRRAMTGKLPESVLQRTTKSFGTLSFAIQLDKTAATLGSQLSQSEVGFVNADGLDRLVRQNYEMAILERPVYELWAVLGCVSLFGLADQPAIR